MIGGILVIGLIIGIIILVVYVFYWIVTTNVKVFEILFGNGWLYFGFLILGAVLSVKNIPLYETRNGAMVYANVGGCIVPVLLSIYLFWLIQPFLNLPVFIVALFVTITVSRMVSWYVKGKGVLGILLIVTFTSALIAHFSSFSNGSLDGGVLPLKLAFGYVIGTIGALVGADLLHLGMIERDGEWGQRLSIGGAGIKDGIWSVGLKTMFWILVFHIFFGW